MNRDPLWQAAQAARKRGGLASVDPDELLFLIEARNVAADLVEDALWMLRHTSSERERAWCDRAETASRIFGEMHDNLQRRKAA